MARPYLYGVRYFPYSAWGLNEKCDMLEKVAGFKDNRSEIKRKFIFLWGKCGIY
jgi:hypothetical protein